MNPKKLIEKEELVNGYMQKYGPTGLLFLAKDYIGEASPNTLVAFKPMSMSIREFMKIFEKLEPIKKYDLKGGNGVRKRVYSVSKIIEELNKFKEI